MLELVLAGSAFLPTAGRATGRVVAVSYLVSSGVSVAVAAVYLAGIGLWAGEAVSVLGSRVSAIGYPSSSSR